MNKKNIVILLIFTYNMCFSQDLVSEGSNRWILHTPDDGRTTMWIAPYTNNDWQWGLATQFLNNGNVLFNGNVGIGTSTPENKLHLNGSFSSTNTKGILAIESPDVYSSLYFGINNESPYYPFLQSVTRQNNNPFNLLINPRGGNVGIGTTTPDQKLTVNGTIHAKEVIVDNNIFPDYVFQKYYTGKSELKSDYEMPSLAEIENFTKKNHHLPNVPSAKEIQEKGLSLGEMSNVLLQKVEELTLYAIEQNKVIEELKAQVTTLMNTKK